MAFYLVFFITSLLAIFANSKNGKIITYIIIAILVVFAGTRLDIDNDFHMYFKTFQYMDDNTKDFNDRTIPLEWSMYFFPNFFSLFFNSQIKTIYACFLVFSFLGVTTKLLAIKKYAEVFILSVMLYVTNLFIMQEMTTIRAGVAAGIFLLSLEDLEKKNNKKFFIKILVCFLFHSSSLLFILAWLTIRFLTNIKYYYLIVVVSFVAAIFKVNLLTVLFLDRIFPRVDIYIKAMEWMKEKDTNIYNFRALFAIIIIFIFAFFYKKLKNIEYFQTLFKIHIISVSVFFLLSSSAPVFSARSFELLAVVQILLYPMIIHIFNNKIKFLGWIVIISYSLLQIFYLINVADIYKPYKSWFF